MLYGEFTFPDSEITVTYEDLKNKVTFVMADASLADRAEYKKKADTADHTSTYTYVFNTSHPLFADVNVRLALSAIIDREAIIEAITFGKAADGFIPDVSGGSDADLISTKGNKEKAESYLAKADQSIVNANRAFTLTVDSDEQSVKIAEIVKDAWESLGFRVTVKKAESIDTVVTDGTIHDSEIQYLIKDASYGKINYDVIAVDWQTFTNDALPGLASLTSGLNGMGREQFSGEFGYEGVTPDSSVERKNVAAWSSEEYDALVAAALACTNAKERKAKLAEAEEYLVSQMPVCPLVFNQSFAFVSSDISKLSFDGLGNFVFTDVKQKNYRDYLD